MSVFKLALPGFDVHKSRIEQEAVDNVYASPKINTLASPPHAGIIYIDWKTTGLTFSVNTVKILHTFKHNYNQIPSCFASYQFDNGSIKATGSLPFQIGTVALIVLDADTTNVNLKYLSLDPGPSLTAVSPFTMQVRFYVFAERGYA